MNKNAMEMIAKLTTMVAISDAQIKSNPIPHLNEAKELLLLAQKCFEDIEMALSPDLIFDMAIENDIRPTDIQGEAYIRCNAALNVIKKYKNATK